MDTQPIQIIQQTQAPARQETSRPSQDRQDGEAFSRHLEKKLETERPKNILKPKETRKSPSTDNQSAPSGSSAGEKAKEQKTATESVVGLLAQLMAHLQALAKEKGMQAGGYPITKADEGILTLMAESAGLDKASLSQLLDKLNAGELTLSDLFSSFGRHFQSLASDAQVTVPDTELPLLASFLQRMGAAESAMDSIAAQAVTGDDQLDLAKFLQALDTVKAPESIALSKVDKEQLEALLAKAGAAKDFLAKLFPGAADQPAQLTLESLKDTLARALADIEQNRPQADLPVFMNELKTLLSQAGFSEKNAGWSPVVQQTMADIHRELGNIVDMATVSAQKAEALNEGDTGMEEELLDVDEGLAADGQAPTTVVAATETNSEALAVPVEGDLKENAQPTLSQHAAPPSSAPLSTPDAHGTRPAAQPHPLPHTARQLVFQQLTDGIHHGLRNREHHLVLRLYPPELGEVKVNLLVRDDQVTINFAMESQRVKDVIENSMQDFKDSLEQRGFVLNGCHVSVDQQDQGEDLWQRWLESGGQDPSPSYKTVRDLPEEALYHQSPIISAADGVNLFV